MIIEGQPGIIQTTAESDRTLEINVKKLRTFNYQYGISPQEGATGVVKIYAKTPSVARWSPMETIDLAALTEPEYINRTGCFDKFKFEPVGVVGSFDIFVYAW